MRLALLVALLIPTVVYAGPKLTLDQALEKALAGPKARMAEGDRLAAAARIDEADAARYPRIKLTGFVTVSPELNCIDIACTQTDVQDFALQFSGIFGGGQLDVTQPLWTFGKIDSARRAARAGLAAQSALAEEAAGDIAADVAKAYWGAKLAREMGYMLEDGIEQIDKAVAKMEDGGDVSIADRQRVAVLLAEARVQRADAKMGEEQALAGLRALVGIADADIDDSELQAVGREVPAQVVGSNRPQARAAKEGAIAADALAEMQAAYYWPDFAVVGSGVVSAAGGVDNPPSVFANDPYNRRGVGLVLALQWAIEPWTVKAKVDRARAEATRAHAQADLAMAGASYDAQVARAEAEASYAKVTATIDGEKAARAWLASVLQADAVGGAEPRDFADAYLAWFQMKARWAQAVFQYNVGVVRLDRATGEFRPTGQRPPVTPKTGFQPTGTAAPASQPAAPATTSTPPTAPTQTPAK